MSRIITKDDFLLLDCFLERTTRRTTATTHDDGGKKMNRNPPSVFGRVELWVTSAVDSLSKPTRARVSRLIPQTALLFDREPTTTDWYDSTLEDKLVGY